MSRFVTVKYLTPVFVEVDLDAVKDEDGQYPDDAVVRVQHGDSEAHRVDDDLPKWLHYIGVDVPIGQSYISLYDPADSTPTPNELSLDEWAKAIDVAENSTWPAWEGY